MDARDMFREHEKKINILVVWLIWGTVIGGYSICFALYFMGFRLWGIGDLIWGLILGIALSSVTNVVYAVRRWVSFTKYISILCSAGLVFYVESYLSVTPNPVLWLIPVGIGCLYFIPRLSVAAAAINIILCYISLIVMRHFSGEDLYKYVATFSISLPLIAVVLIVISVRARSLLSSLVKREEEQKKLLIGMETLIARSADTSGQVYRSGQKLVDAVKTSELSVHSIASMSGELSATIEEVSASLAEINVSSATVAGAATEGGEVLTKANLQMEVIGEIVQKLASMSRELNDSSQKIGEVINVISTIAGQTNLLALNAAIEAARAGEHGRGFALVAVEVKRLADNSSKAAEEVAVLINKVQADTNGIVGAMEEGVNAVNSGSELVQEAGDVFKGILNSTQILADYTAQIATATKEIEQSGLQVASISDEQFSFIQETATEARSLMVVAQELNMNLQRE